MLEAAVAVSGTAAGVEVAAATAAVAAAATAAAAVLWSKASRCCSNCLASWASCASRWSHSDSLAWSASSERWSPCGVTGRGRGMEVGKLEVGGSGMCVTCIDLWWGTYTKGHAVSRRTHSTAQAKQCAAIRQVRLMQLAWPPSFPSPFCRLPHPCLRQKHTQQASKQVRGPSLHHSHQDSMSRGF